MALVGTLVIAMVGISYANSQASLDAIVSRSLDMALEQRSGGEGDKDAGMGMRHLPILWIDLSYDGVKLGSNEAELSIDTGDLATVMGEVVSSDQGDGRLEGSHLSWRRASTLGGFRVVIADTTSIDEEKTSQLMKSALLAVIGMAVTFGLAEALARWAVRPVQLAWDQQHQFVADASHELKTRLASIKLLSDSILQNEMDADTMREFVADIGAESDRLTRMAQKLLTLSRASADETEGGEHEVVDVGQTLSRVFRMLVPLADRQSVKLTASVEKGCTILSFEDDAYQILFNLVENGIKYNRENGSVHVRVRQEDDTVVIDVEDTGSGIPENALDSIFNRFYRVDKARSRQAGGAGLGLSIVHEMVGRNCGTITVRSTVGEGSCFTVTFPSFGSGEEGDPDA